MALHGRKRCASRAVIATVPTVATNRTKRRCHNIALSSSAVPTCGSPSPPVTPSSDCGSIFVSDEDLESLAHLNSETDTTSLADAETDSSKNSDIDLDEKRAEERATLPDSQAGVILKRIAYHTKQGPAKPRHSDRTTELWKTESKFWERFCLIMKKETGLSPEKQLRRCDPAVFKSYLEWRIENFRIKKESAIDAYWKRISMYYNHVVGHAMTNEVLKDVRRWIPDLELDRSKRDKLAMYVQDLFAILYALWVDDKKPLHGFIRVQISALLLLSAATATRPAALVESASDKGSNKALGFRDVELMKVLSLTDPNRSVLVANVNLVHVKNKERNGTSKKFTFHLEGLPAYCIVSHLLAIGFRQDAFRDSFSTIQQIFDLKIPAEREVLRIRWKKNMLDKPFFCNVQSTVEGGRVVPPLAFPYWKYRDIFVRLGRVAGFEANVELYQLRRASGDKINEVLPSTSRNQTMGHSSETYERYYTPTHIARDFQSIYFGTPCQEDLIRSVARMGLSRDRRAPVELDDEQQQEVHNDPRLVRLREKRDKYKHMLYEKGFRPLLQAEGTPLYANYKAITREIVSTTDKLRKERLKEAIKTFHDSIDAIEIERQLNGRPATEILTLPTPDFELRERATIANTLSEPFKNELARVRHIDTLAQLCRLQESLRPKAPKRKAKCVENSVPSSTAGAARIKLTGLDVSFEKCAPTAFRSERVADVQSDHLYPTVLPHPVCLLCIGNEELSYERRMQDRPRKDVLRKHIFAHFKDLQYQGEFECRHPSCFEILRGQEHFMKHALDVHEVCH